jgi:hypothetical protein
VVDVVEVCGRAPDDTSIVGVSDMRPVGEELKPRENNIERFGKQPSRNPRGRRNSKSVVLGEMSNPWTRAGSTSRLPTFATAPLNHISTTTTTSSSSSISAITFDLSTGSTRYAIRLRYLYSCRISDISDIYDITTRRLVCLGRAISRCSSPTSLPAREQALSANTEPLQFPSPSSSQIASLEC